MRYDLDLAIGVLNGAIGDYLARSRNGLATEMTLVDGGRPIGVLAAPIGEAERVVLLVHGLMSTESVFELEDGSTYGSLLERELGLRPLYLRFNSGLHISENGEALDALLEELFTSRKPPPRELVLLGHSMGGLVIRAATHAASLRETSAWLPAAKRAVYVGSPHLGAPLERVGNVVTWALKKVGAAANEPITELVGEVLAMRSNGVKDLRYGNVSRNDWDGHDADALLQNRRHPVPLLPDIRHHLVAGTLTDDPTWALFFGDALVPVPSATGQARPADRSPVFPSSHVKIFPGTNHLTLAHDLRVFEVVREWLSEP